MINWNNMDTLSAYDALKSSKPIHLAAEMAGDNGAKRVKNYTVTASTRKACSWARFWLRRFYLTRPTAHCVLTVTF